MLESFSKKMNSTLRFFTEVVKNISIFCNYFFKQNLPYIVFLVFTYQLLVAIGSLPYFNLITKYYYYVFGFLWILSNFLFKQYITNKRILVIGIIMFILAIPTVVIELEFLSDFLGFAAFIFLFTYVIRQLVSGRADLREEQ